MIIKLCCVLLVTGIFLLFSSSFKFALKELLYLVRPRNNKESELNKHLIRIITPISDSKNVDQLLNHFYTGSFVIFAFVTLLTFRVFDLTALLIGAVFALMPYAFIRIKFLIMQRNGSFEGEIVIKELRNQYRYNYGNMIFAIDKTVENLTKEQKFSKRILMRLSMRLKTYKNQDELNEILNDFRFTYGTKWAKMLSQNIYSSVAEHNDVTAGLDHLLYLCRDIGLRIEKEKQSTVQVAAMTAILSPILVVVFYILAIRMITFEEVMHAQFQTKLGLLMFLAIIIVVLVNIAASVLLKHPKYDF